MRNLLVPKLYVSVLIVHAVQYGYVLYTHRQHSFVSIWAYGGRGGGMEKETMASGRSREKGNEGYLNQGQDSIWKRRMTQGRFTKSVHIVLPLPAPQEHTLKAVCKKIWVR